ncbi:MAG: hypothetical protein AB7Q91_09025 [Phycisphaerales bacterium]
MRADRHERAGLRGGRHAPWTFRACRRSMALALLAALFTGCGQEVRVIRYDPFLAGLPGAEGGQPPVGERPSAPKDPMDVPLDSLVVKNPDGSVTLVAKVIRHLVGHLARVMEEGDEKLLYEGLISETTKRHFRSEGKDPRKEVLDFFIARQEDIYALLARMPAAERTPGVVLSKVGPSRFKLTITGTAARGAALTELWVVMEEGNWRVWWLA